MTEVIAHDSNKARRKTASPSSSWACKVFFFSVSIGVWTVYSTHQNVLRLLIAGSLHDDHLSHEAPQQEQQHSIRTRAGHYSSTEDTLSSSAWPPTPPLRTNPLEVFQEAWYIADEPDFQAFAQIHEDEQIRSLLLLQQQQQQDTTPAVSSSSISSSSYQPYSIPIVDGEPYIKHAGIHPIYTTLRSVDNNTTRAYFNPVCHRYKFEDLSLFPKISIIIPVQNERRGLLTMTVHSVLARTPPPILKEIIIVDDNGVSPEERVDVDEQELLNLQMLHPHKIIFIQNAQKMGCVGARMIGIRAATAEVVVVLDSHVEMYSSTWAQHLLLPILENPRTLSMQTLDTISDLPGHERQGASPGIHYWGGAQASLNMFNYYSRFEDTSPGGGASYSKETASLRLPIETPFVAGSLFAIRRDEFWRLGGYDEGIGVWGGENMEFAMKVWRCGYDEQQKQGVVPPGRVLMVPCTRVGHVFRVHIDETGRWPPPMPDYVRERYGLTDEGDWIAARHPADDFSRIIVRNNMRIFRVWMGKDSIATKAYYQMQFGVNSTDPDLLAPEWRKYEIEMDTDSNIAKQIAIRDKNQCKDFEWFDRHVYYKLIGMHHPWHPSVFLPTACGGHQAKSCGECPQGHGAGWCNGDCQWCEYGSIGDSFLYFDKDTAKNGTGEGRESALDNNLVLAEKSKCVPMELTCRSSMPKFQVDQQEEETM